MSTEIDACNKQVGCAFPNKQLDESVNRSNISPVRSIKVVMRNDTRPQKCVTLLWAAIQPPKWPKSFHFNFWWGNGSLKSAMKILNINSKVILWLVQISELDGENLQQSDIKLQPIDAFLMGPNDSACITPVIDNLSLLANHTKEGSETSIYFINLLRDGKVSHYTTSINFATLQERNVIQQHRRWKTFFENDCKMLTVIQQKYSKTK